MRYGRIGIQELAGRFTAYPLIGEKDTEALL